MVNKSNTSLTARLAGACLVFSLAVPQIVHASIITVNTTDDELNADGDCSFREVGSGARISLTLSR